MTNNENEKKVCPCQMNPEFFHPLNPDTWEYSGVEISISGSDLRSRAYTNSNELFDGQDIIHINFCPLCGRKVNEEYKP